jgi:hypothetical protein
VVPPPKIKVFVKEMVEPSSSVNMEASLFELERRGAKGGHLRPGKCVNCGREEMKSSRSMAKTLLTVILFTDLKRGHKNLAQS